MSALLLFLAAASPWSMPATPRQPPSADQELVRLAPCGLAPPRATIGFEPSLQENVIMIGGGPAPGHDQLECLAHASLETSYDALFEDDDQNAAYLKVYGAAEQVESKRLAREHLREAGLLDKLPRYQPATQSLEDYAKELEALCGLKPGSAARVERDMLTLKPLDSAELKALGDGVPCLADASAASNLSDYQIYFGFLGNEKARSR